MAALGHRVWVRVEGEVEVESSESVCDVVECCTC